MAFGKECNVTCIKDKILYGEKPVCMENKKWNSSFVCGNKPIENFFFEFHAFFLTGLLTPFIAISAIFLSYHETHEIEPDFQIDADIYFLQLDTFINPEVRDPQIFIRDINDDLAYFLFTFYV